MNYWFDSDDYELLRKQLKRICASVNRAQTEVEQHDNIGEFRDIISLQSSVNHAVVDLSRLSDLISFHLYKVKSKTIESCLGDC